MTYLSEGSYPQPLRVGIRVTHMGRNWYRLALALFQEGRCRGVAEALLVRRSAHGAAQASRIMALGVGALGVGMSSLGAAARLSADVTGWTEANSGTCSLSMASIVAAVFLASLVLACRGTATHANEAITRL